MTEPQQGCARTACLERRVARKHVEARHPELGVDGANLVEDGAQAASVLVQQHAPNEPPERQQLVAQVQVRDVAHRFERGGNLAAGWQQRLARAGVSPAWPQHFPAAAGLPRTRSTTSAGQ